ncbi:hypothetical protein [Pseudomonas sp. yb_9]|uniref:hypothetical protein n=1 Tax=Pseudomonas sp. yb_9 TaxID=3367222 RepID=UPI00370BFC57
MSLESEIAALSSKVTSLIDYFNGKKAGIDASVSAAVAAIPLLERVWYVNQQTGDDNAAGGVNTPLKSIDKAVANTPAGGMCLIRLQTDYEHSTAVVSTQRVVNITTDVSGVKRKLTLKYITDGTNSYLSGIGLPSWGSLGLREITLVLPSPAGVVPTPGGSANCLIKIYSSSVVAMLGLKLDACEVQAPADFIGYLMPGTANGAVLQVTSTSMPSGFGGRYVTGVASGTASNTMSNIVTNLATL